MSSRFKNNKDSKPKFRIGGHVDKEQREFFINASKEVKEFGRKVLKSSIKKKTKNDIIKESGRKVKTQHIPFKKAKEQHKVEKEKQDKLITEAILRGEKPVLPKKSNKKDEKQDEPTLKIGKFSNGTLHINKHDIKTVYNNKKGKSNSNRGSGGGGRGGRGGRSGGRR